MFSWFSNLSRAEQAALKTTAISWGAYLVAVLLELVRSGTLDFGNGTALAIVVLSNLAGLVNAASKANTAPPLTAEQTAELIARLVWTKVAERALPQPQIDPGAAARPDEDEAS